MYSGGILSGPLNNFFPNGELSFVTNMLMGKEHGDSVTYYEDGSIQSEAIYRHGVLISRTVHKPK
jgi:antitoxin component YwqK of YwqJK toxin-antitoxin module